MKILIKIVFLIFFTFISSRKKRRPQNPTPTPTPPPTPTPTPPPTPTPSPTPTPTPTSTPTPNENVNPTVINEKKKETEIKIQGVNPLKKLPIKRMLIIMWPGGKTHNYVIKNLLEYVINHQDKFFYEFHILVHNIDIDTWQNQIDIKDDKNIFVYGFGNAQQFKIYLEKSLNEMKNNPYFGYLNFNKGMIKNIEEFLNSNLLEKLKVIHKKTPFDIISTDVPNYIHVLLQKELNIKMKMYLQPPMIIQTLFRNYELNPSYIPAIGTSFTNEMTFFERFKNYFIQVATKIMFRFFMLGQANYLKSKGFVVPSSIHFPDSMHIIQYPLGITFPISVPTNFIFLTSITSQPAKKLEDKKLDEFLNLYKYNIYMSQGTIMKCIKKNDLIDLLKYLEKEKIGVVLNIREDHMSDNEIKNNLPNNIFVVRWVNQNDLLGDKRLKLFITHGGANSVYESTYHGKPMVVLGVGLDQFNMASMVKSYSMGEVFQSLNLITKDNLIKAINKIRFNNSYEINTKKQGNVLKAMKNPREEFKFWLDFVYEVGYDSLVIKAYLKDYTWLTVNGYDIAFVWIIICVLLMFLFKFLIKKIYGCFCGTCEGKHKKKLIKND